MSEQPYLDQTPIECPTCGCHDWHQFQDYAATDEHWLTWQPQGSAQYSFNYETRSTSDSDTGPWLCFENDHEAPDELQDILTELV